MEALESEDEEVVTVVEATIASAGVLEGIAGGALDGKSCGGGNRWKNRRSRGGREYASLTCLGSVDRSICGRALMLGGN